ncbi:hypothetical protein D3C78_388890 [compost metagenome]
MELIPVVDILRDKKGAWKEAHLILFELCNMRCSFCHQDHDSKVGLDGDAMIDKVTTLLATTHHATPMVVNFTGGELFMNEIGDDVFETYYQIGKMALNHFRHIKLVFGTNLVYHNTDRVRHLIERLRLIDERVWLATSYDPAGRFNSAQRDLFFKNLDELGDLIQTVNVVITKQNIQTFLEGKEGEEFAQMCDKYDVYFDHYIPSQLFTYHQPDEELISALYLALNVKYPNSYPIKDWKANVVNETTCRSTKIINKDGVVSTCWSEAGKNAILDEAEGLRAKDEAELAFVEQYGCFTCEYYSRCGLRCFLHHSFIEGANNVCQIKLMFKAIL